MEGDHMTHWKKLWKNNRSKLPNVMQGRHKKKMNKKEMKNKICF